MLPAGKEFNDFDIGLIRLARRYLEAEAEGETAVELERLLALAAPRYPTTQPPDTTLRVPQPQRTTASYSYSQEPECLQIWDLPAPCTLINAVGPPELGDKYLFLTPDIEAGESWAGWVRAERTEESSPILQAIERSIEFFESLPGVPPPVAVWLTPLQGGSYTDFDFDVCNVMLASNAQALLYDDPAAFSQALAFAFATCNIASTAEDEEEWWESGLAWYLSDIVYPAASMEVNHLRIPTLLESEELATAIPDRAVTNMPFFEWLDAALGLDGTIAAARTIRSRGLAAVSDIDVLLHEYEQALTDGVIVDSGGAHVYAPQADYFELSKGLTIEADPLPFGVERIEVNAPPGLWACLEYAGVDPVTVSFRTGLSGSSSGSAWGGPPMSLRGPGVFVVTASKPGAAFSITVKDVQDNAECDPEGRPPARGPSTPPASAPTGCAFCDPTFFLYDFEIDWAE
jgi:hypothetical protein